MIIHRTMSGLWIKTFPIEAAAFVQFEQKECQAYFSRNVQKILRFPIEPQDIVDSDSLSRCLKNRHLAEMIAEFERFSRPSGAYPQGYPQKMGMRKSGQSVSEISAEFQQSPLLFRCKKGGAGPSRRRGHPCFHLMLHPMLGCWTWLTGLPTSTASMAARKSRPVTGLLLPGRLSSNCP